MEQPRVSVLVTAHQHERYIARALDGVLEQRGVDFELLVGDASTDATRAVIQRYAQAHPDRIRTFLPERNLGQGGRALFAALLGQARGELVAGLDGDDCWTAPDKLRRQVAHMDAHPERSMCFHDVLCHYEDGSRPDVSFTGARDAPLYVLAVGHGAIHYLPDVMGVYRIHAQGMYRGLPRVRALELQTSYHERLRVPEGHEAHLRRGEGRRLALWIRCKAPLPRHRAA